VGEDSEMNNEPVAWMHKNPDYPISKNWSQEYNIPLYTHPAKESKAKDRFSNYESICLQCGTTIYKPAFKTLTDEEITEIFDTTFEVRDYQDSFIKFARAILRKAQEK
jgi:hypothetical protein